jgi:sulfite exporter TauE/SafE
VTALLISMFTLGLVTSVHCVSMCGPLVVTYAVKGEEDGPWYRKLIPNGAYQAAKIASYMLVGLLLGAIGSAFNLDSIRPYVMMVAGVFMIIMGLGMTGIAPWAARLTPRPPKFLMTAIMRLRRKSVADAQTGENSLATPIMFGLMTGLMPCAPLIAAQLSAAASGSPISGSLAMLAFGLGTAPLMLAFGTASSMLPKNFKQRMMSVLAIVVIMFGFVYLNRAAMRLGLPVNANTVKTAFLGDGGAAQATAAAYTTGKDGVIEVPLTIQNTRFQPQVVNIPAGKAVRLVVDRKEDNACSAQLAVPQMGVLVSLTANGVTNVDLPATSAGSYTLTCGMGMMSGQLVAGSDGNSGPKPGPWVVLAFTSAGGVLWYGRKKREVALASATCPTGSTPSAASAQRVATTGSADSGGEKRKILGFTPAEIILIVFALAAAVLVGLSAGGALFR